MSVEHSPAQVRRRSTAHGVTPRLLGAPGAAALMGISERRFHQLRGEGWLPEPIVLGPRALRWSLDELLEAIATRAPRGSAGPEPALLVAGKAKAAKRGR